MLIVWTSFTQLLSLYITNCHCLRIILKKNIAVWGLSEIAHSIRSKNEEIFLCLIVYIPCLVQYANSTLYYLGFRDCFDRWWLINGRYAHLWASFSCQWWLLIISLVNHSCVISHFNFTCSDTCRFLTPLIRSLLNLLLLLNRESPRYILVIINDELECAIIIVFEVFEPIVKIVAKSFIWFDQLLLITRVPISTSSIYRSLSDDFFLCQLV